jgi:histidinol-phosphate/aromatic aminotransferase/cobyric acid decarboxylase-like protein
MPPPTCPAPGSDPPQLHGGPAPAELEALGLRPEDVLDFSVSTNPYGPTPAMLEAIRRAPLAVYPDPAALLARRILGAHLGVPAAQLALGNGAADLLWGLARALVRPGDPVLVVEPTFSEFRSAARAAGGTMVEWRAQEPDFAIDVAAVADRAQACRAAVLYLCAPNVPTGAAVPAGALVTLAAALPRTQIVLDQSFLLLSERFDDLGAPLPDNVVRVRSLTKEHNVPGLRVGYVVAPEETLARLEAQRPAWSASAPAQAAVIASCEEGAFVAASRARLQGDRDRLVGALRALGLSPTPSSANFFLLRVGAADELRRRLLAEHGVLVRDCTSFGLPAHIRLAARPAADGERLLAALRSTLAC